MKGFIKKGSISLDTEPIKGSNNAVTSDAVARAVGGGGVQFIKLSAVQPTNTTVRYNNITYYGYEWSTLADKAGVNYADVIGLYYERDTEPTYSGIRLRKVNPSMTGPVVTTTSGLKFYIVLITK